MREFVTTAVEKATEAEGQENDTTVKVDGRECLFHQPKPGQLALLMAMIGQNNAWTTQAEGIINFFLNIADRDTRVHLANRLLDFSDSFDVEQVRDILIYLIEVWTGNPTDEPSGSTGSLQETGPISKQSTPSST